MRILHVKGSNLAWAPDAIAEATNRWTEHTAIVYQTETDEKSDWVAPMDPLWESEFDIVHFHNKPRMMTDKPSLIQYHSEPGPRVDLTYKGPKYVVAQYHMTLPEYADCKPMRNIVNFIDNPLYSPLEVSDKIRVAYSPSILEAQNKWYDKGAAQTIPILERLKAKYPTQFDFDLIHGVPLEECLTRKRLCNIVIDECVTGSYHRSGLEGLAMDKPTIIGVMGLEFEMMLEAVCHSYSPPIFSECPIYALEQYLDAIIRRGVHELNRLSGYRRNWMEKWWHPRDLVLEWIREYERILNA